MDEASDLKRCREGTEHNDGEEEASVVVDIYKTARLNCLTLSACLCELIKVAADVESDLRREERLVQYQSCLPTGKELTASAM